MPLFNQVIYDDNQGIQTLKGKIAKNNQAYSIRMMEIKKMLEEAKKKWILYRPYFL